MEKLVFYYWFDLAFLQGGNFHVKRTGVVDLGKLKINRTPEKYQLILLWLEFLFTPKKSKKH